MLQILRPQLAHDLETTARVEVAEEPALTVRDALTGYSRGRSELVLPLVESDARAAACTSILNVGVDEPGPFWISVSQTKAR